MADPILIVDDSATLRLTLSRTLISAGYQVETVANGQEALASLAERNYALVICDLGACRTLGADSKNRPRRDQFLPDLPPHSPAMGQKTGEKWAGAAGLQPVIPKSDRLLDMPLLDGIGLVLEMQASPRHQYTPVILMAQDSNAPILDQALAAGAVGWVHKPFGMVQMLRVISQFARL